jgi:hypothetical protein
MRREYVAMREGVQVGKRQRDAVARGVLGLLAEAGITAADLRL